MPKLDTTIYMSFKSNIFFCCVVVLKIVTFMFEGSLGVWRYWYVVCFLSWVLSRNSYAQIPQTVFFAANCLFCCKPQYFITAKISGYTIGAAIFFRAISTCNALHVPCVTYKDIIPKPPGSVGLAQARPNKSTCPWTCSSESAIPLACYAMVSNCPKETMRLHVFLAIAVFTALVCSTAATGTLCAYEHVYMHYNVL